MLGYLVDLNSVKLEESTSSSWIQALPYGKWQHPLYGEINVDPEAAQVFASNVNTKVRGQDLDIDYDHKERSGEAAGWVKQAEVRNDGVWWEVEWTPTAFQKLKEKAYRYFSPEFQDEWKHPSTGVNHKFVAFGGGLTNRPFLKGILPINLSEFFVSEQGPENNEGGKMKPEQIKKLAEKLGLAEDATEEQVLTAMETAELKEPEKKPEEKKPEESAALIAANEALAQVKKLAEGKDQAAMAPLVALMESQAKTLADQEKRLVASESALRVTEIDNAVKTLNEKAHEKGFAVPIPVRDGYRKLLSEYGKTKKFNEDLTEFASTFLDAKLVELNERGRLRLVSGGGKKASEELAEKAKKLMEADSKLTLTEANTQIFGEDNDLYERYRDEQAESAEGGAK